MADHPSLSVPPGFEAVEQPDGSVAVRRTADSALTKSVAFRLTTAEYNRMMVFVETFPERSWATALRWLIEHPTTKQTIAERIGGTTT